MSSPQSTGKSKQQTSLSGINTTSINQTSSPDTAIMLQRAATDPQTMSRGDIVQLQRLIGNQATTRLLNQGQTSNITQANSQGVQRAVMSAKDFKRNTYVKWHRRKRIAVIDTLLKKVEQTGADSMNLTELKDAIENWLREAKDDSGRRSTVETLRDQVQGELDKISQSLSKDPGKLQAPRSRRNGMSAPILGVGKKYKSDFSDFDSKQFRVSGRAPDRVIEEVKRVQNDDGSITYYAMGLVTRFQGKIPIIAPYPEPISLGDWYPKVTHINGMAVAPKSGIQSAQALHEAVNQAIGGDDDVALGQDAVDVLYTYSAQRGSPVADVWDCIKGKVQVKDKATEKQQEIMLDAVKRKKRVTVSAHSRGTIKTDNAIRNVHEILTKQYLPDVRDEFLDEQLDYCKQNDNGLIPPEAMADMILYRMSEEKAKAIMNQYIHLVYAGNAVQYPSSVLPPTLYVGGLDPVSMFVGSYTKLVSGAKSVGKTKGHSFVGNYVPSVGKDIAKDLKKR